LMAASGPPSWSDFGIACASAGEIVSRQANADAAATRATIRIRHIAFPWKSELGRKIAVDLESDADSTRIGVAQDMMHFLLFKGPTAPH
jgi:hypothetical protein